MTLMHSVSKHVRRGVVIYLFLELGVIDKFLAGIEECFSEVICV